MAGAVLERKLTAVPRGRVRFAVATQADDAEIRRLLRKNPMPGAISLSLEREPDYFADAHLPGEEKQTIVACENGRVVCVGSCLIRKRFVNGQPCRVGYLGGLRLDASVAGRFDILRRGYEYFRELQTEAPADFYFTSIAADNERARKFLERGLPGMPAYEFIGEFVTLLLPAARRSPTRRVGITSWKRAGSETGAPALAEILNQHDQTYQLSPCWSADELRSLATLGLSLEDVCISQDCDGRPTCAALWDQRSFKQTVLRGYASRLAWARPFVNVAARLARRPGLPAVGTTLAHAMVSHLAVNAGNKEALIALLQELSAVAAERGIQFLTLGFAANDPRLATVRGSFRGREYRSRLYLVRWPEIGGSANELGGRVPAPEVALL